MDLRHVHLIFAKHVLRHLKGTVYYGLKYDENHKIKLHDYVDLDWAGSSIDRKRNLGCCFILGYGMISLFRRKKACMVLSTSEVEYVVACLASCEEVWMHKPLFEFFLSLVRCDLYLLQQSKLCEAVIEPCGT